MKRKNILILTLLLFICTSLIITSAASNDVVENNKKNAKEKAAAFSDVKESDWYYEAVEYVRKNKLMTGTSETEFSPFGETTRGMIVTILWRIEGEPLVEGNNFEDVDSGAWYSRAVAWATNNQIVKGYSETTFAPNDTATREQFATIMYRYASYKKYDLSKKAALDKYEDKDQVSAYAVECMAWANANGIILGTSETKISPQDDVLRSQTAVILNRFCEKFEILAPDNGNDTTVKEEIKNNDLNEKDKTTGGGNSNNLTNNPSEDSAGNDSFDSESPAESDKEMDKDIEIKTALIELKTTYGKAGETIPVFIELRKNPGILGAILTLEYDEGAVTLVDVENGEAVSDILFLTYSKELKSGMNFVWDGLDLSPADIKEGTMLVLYFEISPDAIPGKRYPLKLMHKTGGIIDADLNAVKLTISQGFIEVSESQ